MLILPIIAVFSPQITVASRPIRITEATMAAFNELPFGYPMPLPVQIDTFVGLSSKLFMLIVTILFCGRHCRDKLLLDRELGCEFRDRIAVLVCGACSLS
jgi:hypothetical protein